MSEEHVLTAELRTCASASVNVKFQLLERVELDLGEECKRQAALTEWLAPEPDPREGINGFGVVTPSSSKNSERIYIKEFSR